MNLTITGNDLALASDVSHYTAPPLPRRLRRDLSLLPLWLAERDDCILCKCEEADKSFMEYTSRNLGVDARIGDRFINEDFHYMPWGWSRAVKQEYKACGFSNLPDDHLLAELRQLSSRATSVQLLSMLSDAGLDTPSIPYICRTCEDVKDAFKTFGDVVVKFPWSSSGRGVLMIKAEKTSAYENWIFDTLRRREYLVCEKLLDKVQDFAMEFFCSDAGIEFAGYSVFFNNQQMSYDHALAATTEVLRCQLLKFTDLQTLQRIEAAVIDCLTKLLPTQYYGYVGVDMMFYKDEVGNLKINPCVEMNLRTTMGVVSSCLGNKIISPDKIGRMDVLYHKTHTDLQMYVDSLPRPTFADKKLVDGSLLLVPAKPDSLYTATLTITNS